MKTVLAPTDLDNVTIHLNAGNDVALKYRPYRIVFTLGGDEHEVNNGDTLTLRCPDAFTLQEVRASVKTAGGLLQFNVTHNGTTVFSTPLTIDAAEKTSMTASTPAVLSVTAITLDSELVASVTSDGGGNAFGAVIVLLGKIVLN